MGGRGLPTVLSGADYVGTLHIQEVGWVREQHSVDQGAARVTSGRTAYKLTRCPSSSEPNNREVVPRIKAGFVAL